MMKPSISVALATYNEEINIRDCLESVKGLADEIVVVDGSSTDKTIEIAKKYGARVIVTDNPPIFHINKQKAINAAKGDWILQLDADERVTPELAKEVKQVVAMSDKEIEEREIPRDKLRLFQRHQQTVEKRDGRIGKLTAEVVAFFVARKNYFLGKYLMHGGVYPDGVIRLIKKGKAHFPCKSVHEQIMIEGRVAWLQNDLLHLADPTFSRYLTRSNRYTSLTAQEYADQSLPTNIFTLMIRIIGAPCWRVFSLYFRHKGFLDGFPGFVFALYSGLHTATSYVKYWEKKSQIVPCHSESP